MPSLRRPSPGCTALLAVLVLGFLLPGRAAAQGLVEVKARYTKYEYRIPMRDGKRLFTTVYVPKDLSKTYPILLTRTPYSVRPYGVDQYRDNLGPSALFGKAGYIFAYQDVRGRWMSEGEFVNMRPHRPVKGPKEIDESTDTYDTIAFLLKRVPNHNGKVGQWGISYPGFYTAAGMIDAHPALKAVSPQAPVTDWFVGDDWHHNGALFVAHMFNFLARFDRPRPVPTPKFRATFEHGTPDGYQFFLGLGPLREAGKRFFKGEAAFWDEATKHGSYDEFWKARNIRQHLKGIKPAVLTVGGWFDAENLFGALEVYRKVKHYSPRTSNQLVMGPWRHGGWSGGDGSKLGDVSFNAKTAEFYREQIELPFFEHHLKGKPILNRPEAWVFETGTNVWRQHDTWPPKGVRPRSLFFHAGGKLGDAAPGIGKPQDGHDEYLSDPARPVPYLDKVVLGMVPEYMTADQRFAGRRPDVLVYETEVLEEDVTIAGPIVADLFVSTTGTDSDWVVKVIDVYPNDYPDPSPNPAGVKMGGYQQLVRGDVMRGKFRNSLEKPEPFVPGKPARVKFALPDVYHTFRSGHRIMVQVQSSWFPLVDRNPQTFTDIYAAKAADFRKATQRVYRTRTLASRLTVQVVPLEREPAADRTAAKEKPRPAAVKVTVDTSEVPELADWGKKAKGLVETWYPRLAEMLKSDGFTPPAEVKLVFKKDMHGVAYTGGNTIVIAGEWIKRHPDDYGMVVHELTHVIQAYGGRGPGWLVEGIADYVRFYHFEPKTKLTLGRGRRRAPSYRDGYRTAAMFLAWVVKTHDKDLIGKLNAAIRQGKYRDELFQSCTGKKLDELWDEFVRSAERK
jgi:putative CocE/NonD family hydrolase